ncbi:trihelix transcription factor ASR3 [Fagus crenata]
MKHKTETGESSRSRGSETRRTRSQAAPEWSVKGALILMNEIAAVEADCSNALSSYQKWNIISENCTALDVPRSLNQCRRKWDSLAAEYGKIKQWELRSRSGSYWCMDSERRRQFGLPEDFDNELFKVVDDFVKARENQSDSEPDSDPEAKAEMVDVVEELGSKRQRRWFTSQKSCMEGKPLKCHIKGESSRSPTEEKPQKRRLEDPENSPTEENPQKCCVKGKHKKGLVESPIEEKPKRSRGKGKPQRSHVEEDDPVNSPTEENPQKTCIKGKHQKGHVEGSVESPIEERPQRSRVEEEEETISTEEKEQMMVMKLNENAELINAIVSENVDLGAANVNNVEDYQTNFARCQGDKLIACLRDIVNTLDQLRDHVQECE